MEPHQLSQEGRPGPAWPPSAGRGLGGISAWWQAKIWGLDLRHLHAGPRIRKKRKKRKRIREIVSPYHLKCFIQSTR